jgi:hypothetical protein
VGKCHKFLFWSKVEAAYGLETVITVITMIDSPYIDHMGVFVVVFVIRVRVESSQSFDVVVVEFFPAYLRPCES